MSFNKGDFTQQGVNGHVNAIVRLNEKRLVNIDLTSNEEAEGCTIAGTVTDLLNDKVYPIGSGVSGNIEITENGENINVAPYATATVNVSGGGSTAKTMPVTIINNSSNSVFLEVPYWLDTGYLVGGIDIPANETAAIDANIFYIDADELYDLFLDGTGLSAQNGQFDTVNSAANYATLNFDGDFCEIVLTSPPNPDATATVYIIDVE